MNGYAGFISYFNKYTINPNFLSHHIVLSCPLVTDQGDDITPEPYTCVCKLPPSPPPLTCPLLALSPNHRLMRLGSGPLLQGTQLVSPTNWPWGEMYKTGVQYTRLAMIGQIEWCLLPHRVTLKYNSVSGRAPG